MCSGNENQNRHQNQYPGQQQMGMQPMAGPPPGAGMPPPPYPGSPYGGGVPVVMSPAQQPAVVNIVNQQAGMGMGMYPGMHPILEDYPVGFFCMVCQRPSTSKINMMVSGSQVAWAILMTLCGLCCLPFLLPCCYRRRHSCQTCGAIVGYYEGSCNGSSAEENRNPNQNTYNRPL